MMRVDQKRRKKTKDTLYHPTLMATKMITGQNSLNKTIKRRLASKKILEKQLTAKTRKGMTSMMINVDLTPIALKTPTDPRTESRTSKTPERPSNTWKSLHSKK